MPIIPRQAGPLASRSESVKLEPGRIVEYDQHGKPLLAFVVAEKKGKFQLLNQSGADLELPPNRLALIPQPSTPAPTAREKRAAFLESLEKNASEVEKKVSLEEAWQLLTGEAKATNVSELAELILGKDTAVNHIAIRRALVNDQIYFKRKKVDFELRTPDVVEELKRQAVARAKKEARAEKLTQAILEKVKNKDLELPKSIHAIEQLAALGSKAENAKESITIVEEAIARGKLSINGKPEDKAFKLLVMANHLNPDENLSWKRIGRTPLFSTELLAQAEETVATPFDESLEEQRVDLTSLTTITIDAESTRDMDDALSFEHLENGFRLGIHISDVAAIIPSGGNLESEAFSRGTSIYCPDVQVPMFPPVLSEGLLSLVQDEKTSDYEFRVGARQRLKDFKHQNFSLLDKSYT